MDRHPSRQSPDRVRYVEVSTSILLTPEVRSADLKNHRFLVVYATMSKKKPDPFVINVRGSIEYREFLVEFLERAHARNPAIDSFTKLTVYCLAAMAKRNFGMTAPPNANTPRRKEVVS